MRSGVCSSQPWGHFGASEHERAHPGSAPWGEHGVGLSDVDKIGMCSGHAPRLRSSVRVTFSGHDLLSQRIIYSLSEQLSRSASSIRQPAPDCLNCRYAQFAKLLCTNSVRARTVTDHHLKPPPPALFSGQTTVRQTTLSQSQISAPIPSDRATRRLAARFICLDERSGLGLSSRLSKPCYAVQIYVLTPINHLLVRNDEARLLAGLLKCRSAGVSPAAEVCSKGS
jgi:hypothetical protein